MPTMPWRRTGEVDSARTYVAMLSYLPLGRFRTLPRFIRYSMQIDRQLKAAEGLVGYTMLGRIFAKQFFTLSAWESEEALRRFVEQEPHRSIMAKLVGAMGKTEFHMFSVKGAELPLKFQKELHRLTAK